MKQRLVPVMMAALLTWTLAAPQAAAAPRGDEASARASVLARFDAAQRNDLAALDRLLADDLDYCSFRGDCLTKAQYLELVRSGRLKYLSGNPTVTKIKMFADSAVAIGVATVTVIRDGAEQTIHISWSAVLAWRDNRWQMTTWTATLLENPPK